MSATATKPIRRAWRAVAIDVACIVSATTRAAAIYLVKRSAHEAGYSVGFGDVRAVRAPEYDQWAATDKGTQCWGEEYLSPAPRPPETGGEA